MRHKPSRSKAMVPMLPLVHIAFSPGLQLSVPDIVIIELQPLDFGPSRTPSLPDSVGNNLIMIILTWLRARKKTRSRYIRVHFLYFLQPFEFLTMKQYSHNY